MKKASNGRRTQNIKVEYHSIQLSDPTRTINLSSMVPILSTHPTHQLTHTKQFTHTLWLSTVSCLVRNIKCRITQQPLVRSYTNFKLKLCVPKLGVQKFKMKKTYSGKQPQNMKSGISQQLVISYPNFWVADKLIVR